MKEKTDAYFKADQEARSLRFSEQALRQELTHLKVLQEEDKTAMQREMTMLREQQERELQYLGQIKEASLEKLQTTHALQLKRLQDKLTEALSDNERLAQQCQTLKARLEDTDRSIQDEVAAAQDALQADLSKAKKTNTELKNELEEKEDQINALNTNLERVKTALNNQEREVKRLEAEADNYQQRALDLERNLDSQNRQKLTKDKDLATELERIQSRLLTAEEEKDRLSLELSQKPKVDIRALQSENEDLKVFPTQNLVSALREDLETLRKKTNLDQGRQYERDSSALASKDKIAQQELEISRLMFQAQELVASGKISQENLQRITSELKGKREEIAEKEKEGMRLKQTIQGLKNEMEKVTLERDQLIEISAGLRAEINMTRASVDLADPRRSGELRNRSSYVSQTEEPARISEEGFSLPSIPPGKTASFPKYDRFEDLSVSPPVRDSHLSSLKKKISLVKTELDQNFDLSTLGGKPRTRLFARLEDTPASSLTNTQSFEEKE